MKILTESVEIGGLVMDPMADVLNNAKENQFVFVVGWKGCPYPLGMFGSDEEIMEMVESNPRYIYFLGPSELSDMHWGKK